MVHKCTCAHIWKASVMEKEETLFSFSFSPSPPLVPLARRISWRSAFHFMQTEHRWRQQQWDTGLFISPLFSLLLCVHWTMTNVMSTKDEQMKYWSLNYFHSPLHRLTHKMLTQIFCPFCGRVILVIHWSIRLRLFLPLHCICEAVFFSPLLPLLARLLMNTFLVFASFTLRRFHFNGSMSSRRVKRVSSIWLENEERFRVQSNGRRPSHWKRERERERKRTHCSASQCQLLKDGNWKASLMRSKWRRKRQL